MGFFSEINCKTKSQSDDINDHKTSRINHPPHLERKEEYRTLAARIIFPKKTLQP